MLFFPPRTWRGRSWEGSGVQVRGQRGSESGELSGNPQVSLPGVSCWEAAPPGHSPVQNEISVGRWRQGCRRGKEAANETGAQNERERAGRGKGRPRRVEKGKLRPSGRRRSSKTGQGQQEKWRREGAIERSPAGPGRSSRGGAKRPQPSPARPGSQCPGATRQEGGRAQGNRPRPGRARGPRGGAATPPYQDSHLLALWLPSPVGSASLSRITEPVWPGSKPAEGAARASESHCACVTPARAPPSIYAPPASVTRQRGRRRLRRCRAPAAPLGRLAPALSEARALASFPVILFAPSSGRPRFALDRLVGRVCFLLPRAREWAPLFTVAKQRPLGEAQCTWSSSRATQATEFPGERPGRASARLRRPSERSARLLGVSIWTACSVPGARTPAFTSWGPFRACGEARRGQTGPRPGMETGIATEEPSLSLPLLPDRSDRFYFSPPQFLHLLSEESQQPVSFFAAMDSFKNLVRNNRPFRRERH